MYAAFIHSFISVLPVTYTPRDTYYFYDLGLLFGAVLFCLVIAVLILLIATVATDLTAVKAVY